MDYRKKGYKDPDYGTKYAKTYIEKNKDIVKQKAAESYKKRAKLIAELKSVPCADCGIQYPYYVMDFDHRDPRTKLYEIGAIKMHSMEKLLKEIAKCDVVCANCHRERTFGKRDEWAQKQ